MGLLLNQFKSGLIRLAELHQFTPATDLASQALACPLEVRLGSFLAFYRIYKASTVDSGLELFILNLAPCLKPPHYNPFHLVPKQALDGNYFLSLLS